MITASIASMAARGVIGRLPWRYIGLALAGAALAWGAYSWAWQRGHDSRAAEVALLTAERNAARASVGRLEAAVARQKEALAVAAAKGRAAQEKAAEARRSGDRRAAGVAATVARLAAVQASGGRCVVPDAVRDAWGKL